MLFHQDKIEDKSIEKVIKEGGTPLDDDFTTFSAAVNSGPIAHVLLIICFHL